MVLVPVRSSDMVKYRTLDCCVASKDRSNTPNVKSGRIIIRTSSKLSIRSVRPHALLLFGLPAILIMIFMPSASARVAKSIAWFKPIASAAFISSVTRTSRCEALQIYRTSHSPIKNPLYRQSLLFSSKTPAEKNQLETSSEALYKLQLEVPTPDDMEDVGAILSMATRGGDVILLGGDLGAGKTCFSRGFVRARTGIMDMRVTSPTYLLSNTYEANDVTIHHMDLYRLSGKDDDLAPLNMEYVLKNCISLIEWPSRLGEAIPKDRLEVTFQIDYEADDGSDTDDENQSRILTLEAHCSAWEDRLKTLEDEGYIDDMLLIDDDDDDDDTNS